jgi:hypothetical protein
MDEPGALWIPNRNYFPSRTGQTPRYVIVHGTAGGTDAAAIARYFQSKVATTQSQRTMSSAVMATSSSV